MKKAKFKAGDKVRVSDKLYHQTSDLSLPKDRKFTVRTSRKTVFGRVYYSKTHFLRKGIHEDWLTLVEEVQEIDDQTIHFWNLQLQFIDLSPYNLLKIFDSIRHTPMYKTNKDTKKFDQILTDHMRTVFTKRRHESMMKDRYDLATHIALQLSGIEL